MFRVGDIVKIIYDDSNWDAISILTERKKRCIIYTIGFVYPFDVFKL